MTNKIEVEISSSRPEALIVNIRYTGDSAKAPWPASWSVVATPSSRPQLQFDAELLGRGTLPLEAVTFELHDPFSSPEVARTVEDGRLADISVSVWERGDRSGVQVRLAAAQKTTTGGQSFIHSGELSLHLSAHAHVMGPAEMRLDEFRVE